MRHSHHPPTTKGNLTPHLNLKLKKYINLKDLVCFDRNNIKMVLYTINAIIHAEYIIG